jgi:S1-C subfamily serine protease
MIHKRMPLSITVMLTLVLAGLAWGCGGGGKSEPEPTSTTEAAAGPADLARAVVQIAALDADSNPVWTGSGTVVSPEGLILTNGHVVDDRQKEYASLAVAVTSNTDEPPEPSYLTEIAAVDYTLDLAIIRIVSDLDGNDVTLDLPSIPIGDSSAVEIGDRIRILGYPGIGGETITFTEGTVSGFTAQRDIAQRAWIKTDATIAGGNSGGLAVNDRGEIIGVPTIAGSSEDSAAVDCRAVADTNRDGVVDDQDACVPVGGFINGLRPVALAQPLIQAAEAGETYVSAYPEPDVQASQAFDSSSVIFDDIVFSSDVSPDNQPVDAVTVYPSGVTQACAFWNYKGMADGVSWEALWFIDGELSEAGSITDDTWIGGETGHWWVCTTDDAGLRDGLYEVVLSVEGDFQNSDVIYVGGEHPLVTIGIDNEAATDICYLHISISGATNWGQDDLANEETIAPGATREFSLPSATYDMEVVDCDRNTLYEEYGLDFTAPTTVTVQ